MSEDRDGVELPADPTELELEFLDQLEQALEEKEDADEVLRHFQRCRPEFAEMLEAAYNFRCEMGDRLDNYSLHKALTIARLPPGFEFGDFTITKRIGQGGMGIVYGAYQKSLDRNVAIKFLLDPEFRDRFENEKRYLAKFSQSSIVALYESGFFEDTPYLVMPFIDGVTLNLAVSMAHKLAGGTSANNGLESLGELAKEAKSDRQSPAPAPQRSIKASKSYYKSVAHCVIEIADAVTDCHDLKVAHRDLKPDNVMINAEGHAFIIDFGLAAELRGTAKSGAHSGAATLTQDASGLIGANRYRAPEQVRLRWDQRTDVWGIGCILYELLSFNQAFEDENRDNAPPPARKHNPTVPRDLEAVAAKCLKLDPKHRYQASEEVSNDLRRWLFDQPVKARERSFLQRAEQTVKWVKRHPVMALLLLSGVIALAGYSYHSVTITAKNDELNTTNSQLTTAKADLETSLTESETRRNQILRHKYALEMRYAYEVRESGAQAPVRSVLDSVANPVRGDADLRNIEFQLLSNRLNLDDFVLDTNDFDGQPASGPIALVGDLVFVADQVGGIHLFDKESRTASNSINCSAAQIVRVVVSPDGGQFLVVDKAGVMRVLDAETGAIQTTGDRLFASVMDVAVDWTRQRCAILTRNKQLFVVSLTQGNATSVEQESPQGSVICFGKDGDLYLGTERGRVLQLEAENEFAVAAEFTTDSTATSKITAIVSLPDTDEVATIHQDGTLHLWNTEEHTAIASIDTYSDVRPRALHFLSGLDRWLIETNRSLILADRQMREVDRVRGFDGNIAAVAVDSENATLAFTTSLGVLRTRDLLDPRDRSLLGYDEALVRSVLSPNGELLALLPKQRYLAPSIWDTTTHEKLVTLGNQEVKRDPVTRNIVSITSKGSHSGPIFAVKFNRAGDLVVTNSSDMTARVWDPRTGDQVAQFKHPGGAGGYWPVRCAEFDPADDDAVVTMNWDGKIRRWSIEEQSAQVIGEHTNATQVVFSADGRFLLSLKLDSLKLWDRSWNLVAELDGQGTEQFTGAEFDVRAHGVRLATWGRDRAIRIWQITSGASSSPSFSLQRTLLGHEDAIDSVLFSPDGQRLISTCRSAQDESVRFWDVEIGYEVAPLRGYTDCTIAMGKLALLKSADPKQVHLFDLQEELEPVSPLGMPSSDIPENDIAIAAHYFETNSESETSDSPDASLVLVVAVKNKHLFLSDSDFQRFVESEGNQGKALLATSQQGVLVASPKFFRFVSSRDSEPVEASGCCYWPMIGFRDGKEVILQSAAELSPEAYTMIGIRIKLPEEHLPTDAQLLCKALSPIGISGSVEMMGVSN